MNQKTKVIAVFDGWVYPYKSETEIANAPHLTNLNELHRVALDVMDRLKANADNPLWMGRDERLKCAYLRRDIARSVFNRPINGEYTDLHDAVYESIVYLKQHDLCQPK